MTKRELMELASVAPLPPEPPDSDAEEKIGVGAMIYLQSVAGLPLTPEDGIIGWRQLSEKRRRQTLAAAKAVKADLKAGFTAAQAMMRQKRRFHEEERRMN